MSAAGPDRVPAMPIGIRGLEQDIPALRRGGGHTSGAAPSRIGGAR